jgi:hypothetical protein
VTPPVGETQVWIGAVNHPHERPTFNPADNWQWLELAAWGLVVALVLAGGLAIIRKIWTGEINLESVVSEPETGKASLGRFQALLFTFVFLIAFVLVVAQTGNFPPSIPIEVLFILAGSLGTYLVAKYISGTAAAPVATPPIVPYVVWAQDGLQLTPAAAGATPLSVERDGSPGAVLTLRLPRMGEAYSASQMTVVAAVVGQVTLRLTPKTTGNNSIQYRVGRGSLKVLSASAEEQTTANVVTEITAGVFGPDTAATVDLEIHRIS